VVFIQNWFTKIPIPIPVPDISLLNPPLGLIPPLSLNFEPLNDTATLSFVDAALRALMRSVQHQMKRGEYKQSFTLKPNRLISTLPRVPA
jgi:hypothetical protein